MRASSLFTSLWVLSSLASGACKPAPAASMEAVEDLKATFSDLGRPCSGPLMIGLADPPSSGGWGSLWGSLCDASGTVVGVFDPNAVEGEPPPFDRLSARASKTGESVEIRLAEPYLWVRRVTCGACARLMGWGFAGDLRGLDDDQLRFLQRQLQLPEDPVLRTARDWRRAAPPPIPTMSLD